MIDTAQLAQLPVFHRDTITEEYLDVMGHMNVRWYMALFDEAAWNFFASFGMDKAFYRTSGAGGFALKQFTHYLAEVRIGETVAIRTRLLGRSAKRIHYMHFMLNETTGVLSATLEVLGAFANLKIRRTAPYPDHIAVRIDALLHDHQTLAWAAPICGVIRP